METKIETKEGRELQKTKAILHIRVLQDFAHRQENDLAEYRLETAICKIKEACEDIEYLVQRFQK